MAHTLGATRIAEKSLGTREIMNTNFGRTAFVERHAFGGKPSWLVAVVCNGVADYSETFATRRAAIEAYEAL